jgi:hypothetical protein
MDVAQAEERSEGAGAMSSVSRFHSKLKQRAGEAFLSVRALAMSLGPDVTEKVTDGSVCYMRRDRPFMTVSADKTRLHVAFPREIALPDPNGRLLKRGEERYVAIEGSESVDGHVQEFVRRSYAALR